MHRTHKGISRGIELLCSERNISVAYTLKNNFLRTTNIIKKKKKGIRIFEHQKEIF